MDLHNQFLKQMVEIFQVDYGLHVILLLYHYMAEQIY